MKEIKLSRNFLFKIVHPDRGETVAHYLAWAGYIFDEKDKEILKLKNKYGMSVAFIMARKGYMFNENDIEILSLKTDDGETVAEEMLWNGYKFKNKEALKIVCNEKGDTIAHLQARMYRHKFEDKEILMLQNNYGWTVAHQLALYGYKFDDLEILNLKNYKNCSVGDMVKCFSNNKKEI